MHAPDKQTLRSAEIVGLGRRKSVVSALVVGTGQKGENDGTEAPRGSAGQQNERTEVKRAGGHAMEISVQIHRGPSQVQDTTA